MIEKLINLIKDKGIPALIATAVIMVIFYIGKSIFTGLINKSATKKDSRQIATLLTVLRSIWKYFLLLIWLISMLNIAGMHVTANSLMAAAGAGGLILGIGAQDFVKDIVNGFSIILENRFEIGDYVCINDLFGTVASLTLRTTKLIGDNMETITFPNSQIDSIINYSKQSPTVVCRFVIKNEQDLDKALKALAEVAEGFSSKNAKGKLKISGVTAIKPYGIELGVSCPCKVNCMFSLKCEINLAAAQALIKAGVPVVNDNLSVSAEGK